MGSLHDGGFPPPGSPSNSFQDRVPNLWAWAGSCQPGLSPSDQPEFLRACLPTRATCDTLLERVLVGVLQSLFWGPPAMACHQAKIPDTFSGKQSDISLSFPPNLSLHPGARGSQEHPGAHPSLNVPSCAPLRSPQASCSPGPFPKPQTKPLTPHWGRGTFPLQLAHVTWGQGDGADDALSKPLPSLPRFPSYTEQLCQETDECPGVCMPGTECGTRDSMTSAPFLQSPGISGVSELGLQRKSE